MTLRRLTFVPCSPVCFLALSCAAILASSVIGVTAGQPFRAGAAVVDISPTNLPVIVNAYFTERTADRVVDPLEARALALESGDTRILLCVVDTCMMPRHLIDLAKQTASLKTGIPTNRMLVCATHTHSAPAAMGCLGSRADTNYAAFLPGRIAEVMVEAVRQLAPARAGWATVDDWDHTFNRRWIRRPDKVQNDPFGNPTVRANMHPGHQSTDVTGPSGPVDPGLSVFAVQTADGRPLALLANYSQHYYESPLLSADYFGRFTRHIAALLDVTNSNPSFVAMMSQGTSGDLMWMDYSAPRHQIGYDAYAKEIAQRVADIYRTIQFHESVPLRMAERTLQLNFRVPDASRLAWARDIAQRVGERLPKNHPEIYALEALYLHERPSAELKLQALRIGELGITAIPNEVYAITGLKLKAQSPLNPTFNIELANGAEGYIPPPEQHKLGGYTTWPARTAGLETSAEPMIVDALLELLEEVSDKPRRELRNQHGPYAEAMLELQPLAYWRFNEIAGSVARDVSGNNHHGSYEDGVALFLPGVDGRVGFQPPAPVVPNPYSGQQINRAPHFAGGAIRSTLPHPGNTWSIDFWFWNGLPTDIRPVTGWLFALGSGSQTNSPCDGLGITGANAPPGRLTFASSSGAPSLIGTSELELHRWYRVTVVRKAARVLVYLNGNPEPEIRGELMPVPVTDSATVFIGGTPDGTANFEGKLDEVALFDRVLEPDEIRRTHVASADTPSAPDVALDSLPLSPEESLKKIHVRPEFEVDLVTAEPNVIDPVAIDWDISGRLWVVEMSDYPNGMDANGKPGGRVRVLTDVDGDGSYERSQLFAEELNYPTGILTWRDGVLVTAAPEVLFLQDTDGDGRADVRKTLFSGFLEGNQQLRVNGLRWGLDNWIYCASGAHYAGYGSNTRIRSHLTDSEVPLGSRDFRFRPDRGELDPQSGPSQFGRNRDDWNNWFGVQNSFPLWHYVLPDHYLRRNPHVQFPDSRHQLFAERNPKVYPASKQEKRFHSFNEAGHFTSACSAMIYRDSALFNSDETLHAFVCEPFHNLVHHAVLRNDGVTFQASRHPQESTREFFASEDRWCRPVMARTGPDGGLWVVDMYRYMIEHPEWLPEAGRKELMPHYRAGDDRGRIYRIRKRGAPRIDVPRLDSLSARQLVAHLESSNGWVRDKAQQLLLWRAESGFVPLLGDLAKNSSNAVARVHALWTLHGLDALSNEQVRSAILDPNPNVRIHGLRLAEGRESKDLLEAAAQLTGDSNPKVRLQLAFSLGEWNDPRAAAALATLAVADTDYPTQHAAILSSALPHLPTLADALATAGGPTLNRMLDPLLNLAFALGDRNAAARLLSATESSSPTAEIEQFNRVLDLLERWNRSRQEVIEKQQDDLSAWFERAERLFINAKQLALDRSQSPHNRVRAASLLARDRQFRSTAEISLTELLSPQTPANVQREAIAVLGRMAPDNLSLLLLKNWLSYSPEIRSAILNQLLMREKWILQLLEQIERGSILPQHLNADARSRLRRHQIEEIRNRARALLDTGVTSTRPSVLRDFNPALSLRGDTTHGAALFDRLCANCHRIGERGRNVGPDLTAVTCNSAEKLLLAILDPNALVEPGYAAYTCELADGTELYGLIAGETGDSITLKFSDGTSRIVPRAQIRSLRSSNLSLMPEGLEAGLTPQDLANLIEFLRMH